MASSSFTVLEKYQCLVCAPIQNSGEEKVMAAAKQIRAVNPKAPIIFYFAVDYTRRWYDLRVAFDKKPELEVRNKDGSLVQVHQEDPAGVFGNWHVFDFAKPEAGSRTLPGSRRRETFEAFSSMATAARAA